MDQSEEFNDDLLSMMRIFLIVSYLQIIGCQSVVITMMIMFTKHSEQISDDKKSQICQKFMLVFSDSEKLS